MNQFRRFCPFTKSTEIMRRRTSIQIWFKSIKAITVTHSNEQFFSYLLSTRISLTSLARPINRSRFNKRRDVEIAQINLKLLCKRFTRPTTTIKTEYLQSSAPSVNVRGSQKEAVEEAKQTGAGDWLKRKNNGFRTGRGGTPRRGGGRSVQLSGARGQGAIAHRHHGRSDQDGDGPDNEHLESVLSAGPVSSTTTEESSMRLEEDRFVIGLNSCGTLERPGILWLA